MANKEYKVLIKLQSEVQEARKAIEALNKVSKETIDTQNNIKNLTGEFLNNQDVIAGFNMQLGALAAGGIARLSTGIMQCISDFGAQERATVGLVAALKATGQDAEAVLPGLQSFANNMQRITNVGDEVILEMQGIATAMGVSSSEMEKTIKGAIGLSKAFNMDLQTATKASSAAIQGKTELLTRYIPMLSECKTEAEKLAKVQEAQATGFEMAKSEAQDTLGSIEAMKNSLSDLGEVVGEGVSPSIKILTGGISTVANVLQECPMFTKLLTSSLIGLASSLALSKVGGFAGIIGGFKNIAKSFIGAQVAAVGLKKAISGVALGAGAIGAISLALGSLASWYEKVSAARKEFRENLQKESNAEIERITEEFKSVQSQGLDSEGQRKYVEDSKARIAQIDSEIEHLKSLRKFRTVQTVSTMANFSQTVEDPQNKAINAKIDGLKKLKDAISENSKFVEENKLLLNLQSEKSAAKNREELAKVNAELSESETELKNKIRAETDADFALLRIKELIAKNEARIREIESGKSESQNAKKANALGRERLSLIEKNAELLKEQSRLENNIAQIRQKEENDAAAVKKADALLAEYKNRVKIQNLKADGLDFEAEALEIAIKRERNIADFMEKFASATMYAQDQNQLYQDAVRYADSLASAEQKVLKAKIEEHSLEKAQKDFSASLPLKELEISRARVANDISHAEALEDALEIEKQAFSLRQSGFFTETEALRIASENVNLARKLQEIERSRELQRVQNEAEIADLLSKGKETEAEALRIRTQATDMAERLRIKYSDALKLLRKMNAEQKKEAPQDGKRGSSTSFIRKQQEDIQNLLNSDNLGKRKQGERRQKAFEDRYGIGISDDARSYKGRDDKGKLVDPKVGKEADEKRQKSTDEAFEMASKESLQKTPSPKVSEDSDKSSISSELEKLKAVLSSKNVDNEIKEQKPQKDYAPMLQLILSAIKELRSATMAPQKNII